MADFRTDVINFVKKIPRGKVASYGQVAAACGHPRAARQVGGILRSLDIWGPQISELEPQKGKLGKGTIVPWWRVLNNQGIISIKGNWTATKELQRALLLKEGVKVNKDFSLDIEKHRFK